MVEKRRVTDGWKETMLLKGNSRPLSAHYNHMWLGDYTIILRLLNTSQLHRFCSLERGQVSNLSTDSDEAGNSIGSTFCWCPLSKVCTPPNNVKPTVHHNLGVVLSSQAPLLGEILQSNIIRVKLLKLMEGGRPTSPAVCVQGCWMAAI